jgi:hypothetical protein
MFFRNVGIRLKDYTASQPRPPQHEQSSPWKRQNVHSTNKALLLKLLLTEHTHVVTILPYGLHSQVSKILVGAHITPPPPARYSSNYLKTRS